MATTSSTVTSAQLQRQNIQCCDMTTGQMTSEWYRPLQDLVKLVNAQQATITALQSRLTAAGIPT